MEACEVISDHCAKPFSRCSGGEFTPADVDGTAPAEGNLADPTRKAARDTPSPHVDPTRQVWLEPLCGSSPIELLEAASEELEWDQAEALRVAYVAAMRVRVFQR